MFNFISLPGGVLQPFNGTPYTNIIVLLESEEVILLILALRNRESRKGTLLSINTSLSDGEMALIISDLLQKGIIFGYWFGELIMAIISSPAEIYARISNSKLSFPRRVLTLTDFSLLFTYYHPIVSSLMHSSF